MLASGSPAGSHGEASTPAKGCGDVDQDQRTAEKTKAQRRSLPAIGRSGLPTLKRKGSVATLQQLAEKQGEVLEQPQVMEQQQVVEAGGEDSITFGDLGV